MPFHAPQLSDSDSLHNRNGVGRGSEGSTASEWLSTSLHINQVQARAQSLVINEVGEEVQHITREASGSRLRNEAVHGHGSVGARVQLEGDAVDGGGRDRRAGGRDGARTAQRRKPDHDLVLVGAISGGRQEHVIGDVGDDVGGGVAVRYR